MAAESKRRGFGSWFFWFVIAELIAILVITPLFGREALDWLLDTERKMSLAQLGFDMTLWIERSGLGLYSAVFQETGVEQAVYRFFLPSGEEASASRGLEKLGENFYFPMVELGLDSLFGSLQRFFVRFSMLVAWLPVLPLLVIPAVLHGMMAWKRRQFSFDYASPVVHGWSARTVVWIVIGTPMFLMLPVPVPPMIVPVGFTALAMALLTMTKHIQKRI